MKAGISILLLLILAGTGFSQQDSLHDILPLNVGNSWTYGFNGTSHTPGSFGNDTGRVNCQIINSLHIADSTYWQFIQRRNFRRRTVTHTSDSWVSIIDSGYFQIVESEDSLHTLYLSTEDREGIFFPFFRCFPPPFTRFTLDTSRNVTRGRNLLGFNQCNTTTYTANAILRRDTGLVHLESHWVYIIYSTDMTFDFRGFRPSYAGPHLNHPAGTTITTLVSIPKDTTLFMENDGNDTLRLQNVTCSDPNIGVAFVSHTIPSRGFARLAIHYTSQTAGETVAKVSIVSNSSASPDTIAVTFNNRLAGATQFSRKDFAYGQIYMVPAFRDSHFTITNTGNIPLTFDSTRTSDPDFFIIIDRSSLPQGGRRTGKLRFQPSSPTSAQQSATLLFFTNSVTSPDTIRATGWGVGGKFVFSPLSLDFGQVRVGQTKDSTITVTRIGIVELGCGWQTSFHPTFAGVGDPYIICRPSCPPFLDTVRFTPDSGGLFSGYIAYTTSNGNRRGYDTIWLSGVGVRPDSVNEPIPDRFALDQNYPNPFNPTTTISFQLPAVSNVTLKVFDLLGREVAALVNEEMQPGSYERVFSAEGLASGVYLYQLRAGDFVQTRKLLLLR